MKNFRLVGGGLKVGLLNLELIKHPELWNANKYRTTFENTPHGEVDDIWIRYAEEDKTTDEKKLLPVQNGSGSIWYPASKVLTEVQPLVLDLMAHVKGYELARVVITRVKPGAKIIPHADNLGDYVHLGDIARYHIVLQGFSGSMFHCGGEEVNMQTGEIWWFNAHEVHEVINNSANDRLHLIVDVRSWNADSIR